jgi:hypothetical protein
VTIYHEKGEQSRGGDVDYEFSWRCEFEISRVDCRLLRERAYVAEVKCADPKVVALIQQAL